MTASAPVESVIEYLSEYGYRQLPGPFVVGQLRFEFPAVMIGPEQSSDLVLVADTLEIENDQEIVRRVLGVARALDMARAHNPLTTVIVGTRPNQALVSRLMSVSRVLAVGPFDDNEARRVLSNWLAVLTPLPPGAQAQSISDPLSELLEELVDLRSDVAEVVQSARAGPAAVEAKINALLTTDLEAAWDDEGGG